MDVVFWLEPLPEEAKFLGHYYNTYFFGVKPNVHDCGIGPTFAGLFFSEVFLFRILLTLVYDKL